MTFTFTVDGWQDWDGNRREGEPDSVDDTQGMFVHAWDADSPDDEHYFWVYIGGPFEEWDEWWVLVGAMMDMHGMSIS